METLIFYTKALFHETAECSRNASAEAFFFERMIHSLLTALESSVAQERAMALSNTFRPLPVAPSSVMVGFIETKTAWSRIKTACGKSLENQLLTKTVCPGINIRTTLLYHKLQRLSIALLSTSI
jgi:hypothetical protein